MCVISELDSPAFDIQCENLNRHIMKNIYIHLCTYNKCIWMQLLISLAFDFIHLWIFNIGDYYIFYPNVCMRYVQVACNVYFKSGWHPTSIVFYYVKAKNFFFFKISFTLEFKLFLFFFFFLWMIVMGILFLILFVI